jgi:hypothetical protein
MRLGSELPRGVDPTVPAGAALFVGFSAAHLIDEFLWGAPAEFHLSIEAASILALVFLTSLAGLLASACRGRRAGYVGLAIAGILIAVADALKHVSEILAPGHWRSGAVSEFLALGLTLSAVFTAGASVRALRRRGRIPDTPA